MLDIAIATERHDLETALIAAGWNMHAAARSLQTSVSTVRAAVARHPTIAIQLERHGLTRGRPRTRPEKRINRSRKKSTR